MVGLAHADEQPQRKLDLHVVLTPIKSYRPLAMSMDDDGYIWAGSIHKVVHRYDPRTGQVEDVPLPCSATASACLCVGQMVYILGQMYPKLIVCDRTTKKFSEIAYPSSKPNVWYGTEASDGRHLYLFDRGSAGVIQWDTQTDSGKAIPWPYKAPFPSSGRFEPGDKAIWCNVWETGGQYRPLGIARLDVGKNEFTGFFPFPEKDVGLKPYTDPATTLSQLLPQSGKRFGFDNEYDFGNSWWHEVLFEGCLRAEPGDRYPVCVEGERACPPEDVGGVWSYPNFVDAIKNPEHERHEELLEWVGGSFDPEAFDPAAATQAMRRQLPDWRAML